MTQKTVWDKIDKSLVVAQVTETQPDAPTDPGRTPSRLQERSKGLRHAGRDLIAIIFWTYIVLQLFVFDVDTTLITPIIPGVRPYLRYKAFVPIFVFVLIVFWWRKFLLSTLYIVFFPFILLLWLFPRAVFRHRRGAMLLSVSNIVGSVLSGFRHNVASAALWLLAVVIAIASHSTPLLIFALVALFAILLRCYYRTIRYSFTGSRFVTIQSNLIARLAKADIPNTRLDDELKSEEVVTYSKTQLDRFTTTLGTCIAVNRVLRYWAYHLDQYRRGPLPYLFSLLTYIWLLLATLLTLSFANIAVLHLSAKSFAYTSPPSVLTSVHFTLASLVISGIPQVTASSDLAQIIQIATGILGPVLFLAVVANLLFTTRQFKEEGTLQVAIANLKAQGDHLRDAVQADYQTSLEDAWLRLQDLGANVFGSIIKFFSRDIPDDFS